MKASQLVGKHVQILVSDPWEFGTECGVGPFAAVVTSAENDALLLSLEVPIDYHGARLKTVVATPRHAPGKVEPLLSKGSLATNLAFLLTSPTAFADVTNDAKAGMVAAIGNVDLTSG
jgi:hypothetical protein